MTVHSFSDHAALVQLENAGDDAVRWALLLVVFGGDAVAWANFLSSEGSSSQRHDDLPFARSVARRCVDDEGLRLHLRELGSELQSQTH